MTATRTALAWAFFERYVNVVLTIASSMLLARLLTPAEIGLFSVCAASMAISGAIRDFGVGEYIIKEKVLARDTLRNALAVALVSSWGVGAAIFLGRDLLADHYAEPRISALLGVMCINFLLLPFTSPAAAVLSRDMEFKRVFALQLFAVLAGSVTSVSLALAGFGAISLAWGSVAAMSSQLVFLALARRQHFFLTPLFRNSARIFKFGTFQIGSRLLETATSNAHEFIIASHFGFAQVGIFSKAKGVIDLFQQNVTLGVARVATPSFARTHRHDKSLVHDFAHGTAVLSGVSWPFFLFVAITAPEIIVIMFGPQWVDSGPLASALALSMLPTSLFAISSSVLSAMGQVKRRLLISLQWCPIHLAALIISAQFSLLLVACAWLVTNMAMLLSFTRQLKVLLNSGLRQLYGQCIKSALLAVVVGGIQFGLMWACRHALLPKIASLAIVFLVSSVVWVLCARAINHPIVDELNRVGGKIRAKLTRGQTK